MSKTKRLAWLDPHQLLGYRYSLVHYLLILVEAAMVVADDALVMEGAGYCVLVLVVKLAVREDL